MSGLVAGKKGAGQARPRLAATPTGRCAQAVSGRGPLASRPDWRNRPAARSDCSSRATWLRRCEPVHSVSGSGRPPHSRQGYPAHVSEAALKALVDAARKGDRFAFDELVRVTWAGTYTLAFRLTGNEEDALDVTQEAYLRAFARPAAVPGRGPVLDVALPGDGELCQQPAGPFLAEPPRPAGPGRDGRGECPRPAARARPRGLGVGWRRASPPGSSVAAPTLAAASGSGASRRLRPFSQGDSGRARDTSEAAAKVRPTEGPQAAEGGSGPTAPGPGGSEPTLAPEPAREGKPAQTRWNQPRLPRRLLIWMTMPWPAEAPKRPPRATSTTLRALLSCEAVSEELPAGRGREPAPQRRHGGAPADVPGRARPSSLVTGAC